MNKEITLRNKQQPLISIWERIKNPNVNKKRILWFAAFTKVPFLIYLVMTITVVPAISDVNYSTISGAHRGDSVKYVENTLPAIKSAVENEQYKFIEFDLIYTKDKEIVVHHDASLFRMQQKTYDIGNLTYEELQNLSDYIIPLYGDVMDVIGDKKKVNIEIKSSGDLGLDGEMVDFVVADLKERGILKNAMISSISSDVIKYIGEKYPAIKTGKIYWITYSTFIPFDFLTEELYAEMNESGADYLMLHGSNINNIDSIMKLKPTDKTVCLWYFNNEIYIIQKDEGDCLW